MSKILPIGTRIKFLRDIKQGPTSETPAFLFAYKNDLGTVTGHECWEGHMVKWDKWQSASFGAVYGEDFIELKKGEENE